MILTYGDRVRFVNQIIKALQQQKVDKIIVVANGTPQVHLEEVLTAELVKVVALETNTGSGHGFSIGIKEALKLDIPYLWLLDDDNLPGANCLETLKLHWRKTKDNNSQEQLVLSCYRKDQFENRELHISGSKLSLQPLRNSYQGFHIGKVGTLINQRILHKPAKRTTKIMRAGEVYETDGAFFGGLFFHKSLLDQVSLPDDEYFVYADDLDFTHRITMQGGKILLICDAVINGLDCSIPLKSRTGKLYHSTLDYEQPFRTYYCARNVEHLTRKYFVTNRPLYFLNLGLFVIVIGNIALIRGKLIQFKLILSGIMDSWNGRFGKSPKFHQNSPLPSDTE